MHLDFKYCINQLRDYSSLFSRNEAKAWMKNDFSSIDFKIKRYDINWQKTATNTYLDYLKYVYQILEVNYQNEYIFKNSFLNEWLIKEIGQSNSKVFSEYRVGNAIADLVMFNGISRVFEIKTEFDTTKRLDLQIENYKKAFNEIYLIIPESKLSYYEAYSKEVGLITFNNKKNKKFIKQREASINLIIDSDTIMHILHTNEYRDIVLKYFGKLPEMTSFNQFEKCKELLNQIPNLELNKLFIKQMKVRNSENFLDNQQNLELNQINLALKLNHLQRKKMIEKLLSPLKV